MCSVSMMAFLGAGLLEEEEGDLLFKTDEGTWMGNLDWEDAGTEVTFQLFPHATYD